MIAMVTNTEDDDYDGDQYGELMIAMVMNTEDVDYDDDVFVLGDGWPPGSPTRRATPLYQTGRHATKLSDLHRQAGQSLQPPAGQSLQPQPVSWACPSDHEG